jgi:copper oxidase (laccase) domain-containing protein
MSAPSPETALPSTALRHALALAGLDWIVPDWPVHRRVGAVSTTRNGGVSVGARTSLNLGRSVGDDARAVEENRRRIARFLPAAPVWLHQTHGIAVATLSAATANGPAPLADAAVTREPGIVCTVTTADCLPVLFADSRGSAVGIAHAGWRGLSLGVLEATVGDDVRDRFCDGDRDAHGAFAPHAPGKWLADLYALARMRLSRAGVRRVSGGGFCTHADAARFFSYRRERDTGRMATAIWLTPVSDAP